MMALIPGRDLTTTPGSGPLGAQSSLADVPRDIPVNISSNELFTEESRLAPSAVHINCTGQDRL